jgi:pimeloyl-ACP methyl ester carboxylesterase
LSVEAMPKKRTGDPDVGFAEVNGLRMYYEVHGAGRPLVLLHGSLMTIDLMGDYVTQLASARQVVAVELQAHGRTRDINRPLRYELMADDIAALVEHLGLAQADVFGYSTGAAVALQLGMRHPARVRRIVAASVSYRSDGLHPQFGADAAVATMLAELENSVYHQAYLAVAPDTSAWPGLVEKVLELDAQPQDWPADDIASIAAPVMLIAADNDIVRLEHTVDLYHLLGGGVPGDLHGLPSSWLAVVPGTTHAGMRERAVWVAPLIAGFLAGAGTG